MFSHILTLKLFVGRFSVGESGGDTQGDDALTVVDTGTGEYIPRPSQG